MSGSPHLSAPPSSVPAKGDTQLIPVDPDLRPGGPTRDIPRRVRQRPGDGKEVSRLDHIAGNCRGAEGVGTGPGVFADAKSGDRPHPKGTIAIPQTLPKDCLP